MHKDIQFKEKTSYIKRTVRMLALYRGASLGDQSKKYELYKLIKNDLISSVDINSEGIQINKRNEEKFKAIDGLLPKLLTYVSKSLRVYQEKRLETVTSKLENVNTYIKRYEQKNLSKY